MFKNPDTMVMALQKGEIDVTYVYGSGVSYYYVPGLLANKNIAVMTYENTWNVPYVLFFNTNVTPYDNVQFREAVGYAIDYNEIKNLMTAGYGKTPNAGFVPDSFAYYTDTRALARDLNKSRAMLDALGYADRDGDGFREAPDGKKFAPELLVINYPDDVRLAQLIKKYFNDVGLDVVVDAKDEDTAWDILDVKKTYDMALSGSGNVGAMYAADIVDTRYYGWAMVDDSVFTAIVDRFLGTADEGKRRQAAVELQEYYASEYPIIALYWDEVIQPYNNKYTGYVPNPKHGVITYGTLYGLRKTE